LIQSLEIRRKGQWDQLYIFPIPKGALAKSRIFFRASPTANGDEIAGSDEFLLVTEEEELLHGTR
jgi:hypothetical protein